MDFVLFNDPRAAAVLVARLVRILTLISLVVFLCMIVWGGAKQISSSGRDQKVRRGRKAVFIGMLWGLFMLVIYLIATNIVDQLGQG